MDSIGPTGMVPVAVRGRSWQVLLRQMARDLRPGGKDRGLGSRRGGGCRRAAGEETAWWRRGPGGGWLLEPVGDVVGDLVGGCGRRCGRLGGVGTPQGRRLDRGDLAGGDLGQVQRGGDRSRVPQAGGLPPLMASRSGEVMVPVRASRRLRSSRMNAALPDEAASAVAAVAQQATAILSSRPSRSSRDRPGRSQIQTRSPTGVGMAHKMSGRLPVRLVMMNSEKQVRMRCRVIRHHTICRGGCGPA